MGNRIDQEDSIAVQPAMRKNKDLYEELEVYTGYYGYPKYT